MRITIIGGFFLPIPPVGGGATEKSWYRLAQIFALRGHEVTFISRRWPGWPNDEKVNGIRHLRLPGADHRRQIWHNLFLDFIWSWRAFFALPAADIVVVNTVALPVWLGLLKPRAGRVVLMTGRMPKGQYRHYRRIARILASSSVVRDRAIAENPALAPVMQVRGYPIDWELLNRPVNSLPPTVPAARPDEVIIGFVGRLHEEKGLRLLVEALALVAQAPGLPAWRLLLCGPADVAHGGSGAEFRTRLLRRLSGIMQPGAFTLLNPHFNDRTLAGVYQQIGIFCYPSLAEKGETFGVAIAEAMAAGAVPVVSQLECFTDFMRDDENGLIFDHRAPDAAARLAAALIRLLREPILRRRLGTAARATARNYDYAGYADALLADFAQLTDPAKPPSSAP
jgi:glycosyltransferase involved in cell wall biosynthesis